MPSVCFRCEMTPFLSDWLPKIALQYLKELMNVEEAALQAGRCQSSVSLNVGIVSWGLFQALHADTSTRRNTNSSRLFCILSFHGDEKVHVSPLNSRTFSMTRMKITRSPFVHCEPSASNDHATTRHGMLELPSAPSRRETMGISREIRRTLHTSCVSETARRARIVVGRWTSSGTLTAQCSCGPALPAGSSHSGSPRVHFQFPMKRSAGLLLCPRGETPRYSYITRRDSVPSTMPGSSSSRAARHSHPRTASTHKTSS